MEPKTRLRIKLRRRPMADQLAAHRQARRGMRFSRSTTANIAILKAVLKSLADAALLRG